MCEPVELREGRLLASKSRLEQDTILSDGIRRPRGLYRGANNCITLVVIPRYSNELKYNNVRQV